MQRSGFRADLYVGVTGAWFLRDANEGGPAGLAFGYGAPGATPLSGKWKGAASGWRRQGKFNDAVRRDHVVTTS